VFCDSDLDATREFAEDHVDLHPGDGLVSFDHDPQDAQLVAHYDTCSNQTQWVEEDRVRHVPYKVIRSVPEEDTPEPGRDASSGEVVVALNGFFKGKVSVLLKLVTHTSNCIFISRSTLSEGHPCR